MSASNAYLAGSLSTAQTPTSHSAASLANSPARAGSVRSATTASILRSGRRSRTHSAASSAFNRPTADAGKRCRWTLCGAIHVRLDERDAGDGWFAGEEVEDDDPAATGADLEDVHDRGPLLGFGQRPLPAFVPELVTRQPAPRGEDREDASELRRVPAARGPRRSLPPQAECLPLEQVRAVLQRREDSGLGRNDGVTGKQAGFELVDVVARLEAIATIRATRRDE